MIPQSCLLIETMKFPVLEAEQNVLINEGMVGRALCIYLQVKLPLVGFQVPFFCSDDWGWWLQTDLNGFQMGLCIYSDPDAAPDPERYALMPSIQSPRQWSWSRFRWIDRSQDVMEIMDALENIFTTDTDIQAVTRNNDHPF